jgi:hypothetical protein
MASMKFQFGLSTLLLVVVFFSVWAGALVALWKPIRPAESVQMLIFLGPYWVPLVFAAFAVGRKSLTVWMVLAFSLSEAASIGGTLWIASL